MNILKDILYKSGIEKLIGSTDTIISQINFDSRKVVAKSLFVAIRGTHVDGHCFIDQSIEDGAIAVVCEEMPEKIKDAITYIIVNDSDFALGQIASNFYDDPSSEINLIGITGTNGKTTTVSLLFNLFRALGNKCGLLSTIENKIENEIIDSTHTTPDAIQINKLLRKMVDKGCSYCFMEVSSHAIMQNRISGLNFIGGLFTNITHDHLDYHKTFDEYIKAKKKFFDNLPKDSFALTNADDKNGNIMLQNTKAKKYTYSLRTLSDYKCKIIENQFDGLQLNIDGKDVWFKLTGVFNAYNLLAAYSIARQLDQDSYEVLTILSMEDCVEGRFDFFKTNDNIVAIVDYAHTPDALKNVMNTISSIRTGNEKLITVVGTGGDRDKLKRPIMTRIAAENSDMLILTSDNPRSEDPKDIIEDMKAGIDPVSNKKIISITDRKEAIKTACIMAQKGDIILVAGKGHEKYQEIKGVKLPFDDKDILKQILLSD